MRWKPWPSLHTHKWRRQVAINDMALNEAQLMFHTQLSLFVFLPYPFHLVPNWLQAWLALEFVQLHSTPARRGTPKTGSGSASGFAKWSAASWGSSIPSAPPPARAWGQGLMPEPTGHPRAADLWPCRISCSSIKFFPPWERQLPKPKFRVLSAKLFRRHITSEIGF